MKQRHVTVDQLSQPDLPSERSAFRALAAHLARVCPKCAQALAVAAVPTLKGGPPATAGTLHVTADALRYWLRADDQPLALHMLLHQAALCQGCCAEAREAAELHEAGLLSQDFLIAEEDVALARSRRQAPARLAALESLPPAAALALVRKNRRFHSWGLAERLCARSIDVARADHHKALALADLAVAVASRVDPAGHPPNCTQELLMLAQAARGNALRVVEDTAAAEEAFRKAEEHWQQAWVRAFHYRAKVLALKASLERYQRRFEECLETIEEALAEARERAHDSWRIEATLLLQLSLVLTELDRIEEANEAARTAEALLDAEGEAPLRLAALQNQLFVLPRLGRLEEAANLLPKVEALAAAHGAPSEILRVEWARARYLWGIGERALCLQALDRVHQEFTKMGKPYSAAAAALELAEYAFEGGQPESARSLAFGALPIFRQEQADREIEAALQLIRQATAE